jgi:hypothetical protein
MITSGRVDKIETEDPALPCPALPCPALPLAVLFYADNGQAAVIETTLADCLIWVG